MRAATAPVAPDRPATPPNLLCDDECGACRRIAAWVRRSAQPRPGALAVIVRPLGEDPAALRALNPALDIWDACDTIHLLQPDASRLPGGPAIAERLRCLPSTRWLAGLFTLGLFGWHPFQQLLSLGYLILADLRPLFGCERCGAPSAWLRPLMSLAAGLRGRRGPSPGGPPAAPAHFTPR